MIVCEKRTFKNTTGKPVDVSAIMTPFELYRHAHPYQFIHRTVLMKSVKVKPEAEISVSATVTPPTLETVDVQPEATPTVEIVDVQPEEIPTPTAASESPVVVDIAELRKLGDQLRTNMLHGWTGLSGEARFWRALGYSRKQ